MLDGGLQRLATPLVQGIVGPGIFQGQPQVFQVGLQQPVLQQAPIGQTLLGGQVPISGSGAGGGQAVIAELSRELQAAHADLNAANASASQAAQQAAQHVAQLEEQHRYQDQLNQMNQQYMLASIMSMGLYGNGALGYGAMGYGPMAYGSYPSAYGSAGGGVVRSDPARSDFVREDARQDDSRMGYGYDPYDSYDPEMDLAMGEPFGGIDPVDGFGPTPFVDRAETSHEEAPDPGMLVLGA
jgi:hypothetical protein